MVSRPVTGAAAALRDRAIAAARSGDPVSAGTLFRQAVEAAPKDAAILNSAASHFSRQGETAAAIDLLETAVAADPSAGEPVLNLALLLTGAERPGRALELLLPREEQLGASARYWSIRAGAERALRRKGEALSSFERAVSLDTGNARALEGRARLALETGLDATEPYRAALAAAPASPTAQLGYGQALEAAGHAVAAVKIAEQLVAQLPGWPDALEWLAQLRWGAGERSDFTDHYRAAAAKAGNAASQVYSSWCRMLSGVDRFAEAAAVAAAARQALGDPPHFALVEAMHRGEAGDDDRAEEIFAGLALQTVDRRVQESRHRLRRRQPDKAEALLASVIEEVPDHISAWALRDIGWRLSGDSRHEWLHGQAGLVGPIDMNLEGDRLASIVRFLDTLHDRSSMPVGQSVRDGSQTRGGLFDRHEPEVAWIEDAFRAAVEEYRAGLPPRDESHPLLRHRDDRWSFAGSWSIRVLKGGRHTEHIHPQGLLSSAAYFVVPPAGKNSDPKAGWLELGRPPPDLRLDLPPLHSIEPVAGCCALFPSTLYHGTRKFEAGKRMTVAVDIHLERGA